MLMRVLSMALMVALLAPPAAADVGIFFRPVDERPGSRSTLYPVRGTNETVRLEPGVVLDSGGVATVSATQDPTLGTFGLTFRFTPEGAERMREWSSRSIGRRLALLVDGEVLATPRIMETVSDTVVMSGLFTELQARRMAAQMTAARTAPRLALIVARNRKNENQDTVAQVAWQRLVLKRTLAGYLRSRLPVTLYDTSNAADRAACAKLGIATRDLACVAVVRLQNGRAAAVVQRWTRVSDGAAAANEAFRRVEAEGVLPEP